MDSCFNDLGNNDITSWIGDGSEGNTLDVRSDPDQGRVSSAGDSVTISFSSATQGRPFNIRLGAKTASSDENIYYEFTVVELRKGTISAGFVTEDGFQPGWKTKGYFYNGNITNGSAGLIIGFGEFIKNGDVVGVYLQRTHDHLLRGVKQPYYNIIFYHNRRCLGPGFSIGEPIASKTFYPCFHLGGSAIIKFVIPKSTYCSYPSIFEREPIAFDLKNDPYSGDWLIIKVFSRSERHELSLPPNSTLKVSLEKSDVLSNKGQGHYAISVKVDNSYRTSFGITGKAEEFDKIEITGNCIATRKLPRPEYEQMERFVQSMLEGGVKALDKIISHENGCLILSGPAAEITCSRFVEEFDPVIY